MRGHYYRTDAGASHILKGIAPLIVRLRVDVQRMAARPSIAFEVSAVAPLEVRERHISFLTLGLEICCGHQAD